MLRNWLLSPKSSTARTPSSSDPLFPDLCPADIWEHYLLELPDKEWKEEAERQGWIEPDVVIQDDGKVVASKPELSEFFQNFDTLYMEQGIQSRSEG